MGAVDREASTPGGGMSGGMSGVGVGVSVGVGGAGLASGLDDLIAACERAGRGDRAVAMAVWHGQLRKAVKSLDRGAARRMEVARKLARDAQASGRKMSASTAARANAAAKVGVVGGS